MKMIPFPERGDAVIFESDDGKGIVVVDAENFVMCADDGASFQLSVAHDDIVEPDIEVRWDVEKKVWSA